MPSSRRLEPVPDIEPIWRGAEMGDNLPPDLGPVFVAREVVRVWSGIGFVTNSREAAMRRREIIAGLIQHCISLAVLAAFFFSLAGTAFAQLLFTKQFGASTVSVQGSTSSHLRGLHLQLRS